MKVVLVDRFGSETLSDESLALRAALNAHHCDGQPIEVVHAITDNAVAKQAEEFQRLGVMAIQGTNLRIFVVFGGDGTMLNVARTVFPIPVLGVNHGRLGFVTDLERGIDPVEVAKMLVDRKYWIERRKMICVNGKHALNDMSIRGLGGGMLEMDVLVNGVPAYRVRGDGILISTPTGSTAYNLSANGPIMHPDADVICITPLHPQTLSNRPIVLSAENYVTIKVQGDYELRLDGQLAKVDENEPDVVLVEGGQYARFLHLNGTYDYFYTLRQKLNWFLPPC